VHAASSVVARRGHPVTEGAAGCGEARRPAMFLRAQSTSRSPAHTRRRARRRDAGACSTTGNAASTESSALCRELCSVPRARSKALGTWTQKNPRYRRTVPRGNRAASRHSRRLTAHKNCAESSGAGPQHSRDLTAQSNGRHGRWPDRQMCREPTYGSRHRNLCRVPDKGSRQRIKKIKFTHSNFFFINLHPYKKHMLKFHIKIDIYFVFNNFISFLLASFTVQ
jgi:hypothetical protein